MFGFSRTPAVPPEETLKEKVKEWQSELRAQTRDVERQVRALQREEGKMMREAKAAAKKNEMAVVKIAAKHIAMGRKTQDRLHVAKAHIQSISMQLAANAAQIRVAHTMKKSTDMMRSMNNLIKVPELMGTMRRMSEEMSKAGIMEEMITDAMDSVAPEGLDEEADDLTDAVLFEVTDGVLGKAPSAPIAGLPTRTAAPVAGAGVATGRVAVAEGADDADLASLRDQLGKI